MIRLSQLLGNIEKNLNKFEKDIDNIIHNFRERWFAHRGFSQSSVMSD